MKRPLSDSMIGKTYGRLTVVGYDKPPQLLNGCPEVFVRCRCACGKECSVRSRTLRAGTVRSCGCLRRETAGRNLMGSRKNTERTDDMIGRTYGRLTVLRIDPVARRLSRTSDVFVQCRCACGRLHSTRAYGVRKGKTKSCGCLREDLLKEFHARRAA